VRVIPVIDLMNGQVVRGVAGRRSEYRPIDSRIAADAQPATVARALVEHFGFDTVYAADLDAIVHGQPNVDEWKQISDAGLRLWLDAGVGTPQAAVAFEKQLKSIVTNPTIVVGLESLITPTIVMDLAGEMAIRFRATSFAFSLDLQNGRPLTRIDWWKDMPPIEIAHWLMKFGVRRLIVLDLADVGVGGGTRTLELCREIRRKFPAIELIAGGGVRGIEDLKRLADAGCDAALVASALHDGRLTREEIRRVHEFARGGRNAPLE
jgi:phosphoribosylformimino-5-aminoimidazole carboxamide ribotide isomerase